MPPRSVESVGKLLDSPRFQAPSRTKRPRWDRRRYKRCREGAIAVGAGNTVVWVRLLHNLLSRNAFRNVWETVDL